MNRPLTLMQAVDHLTDMAEIHPQSSWIIGVVEPFVFEDFSEKILWEQPKQILQNKEIIRETFSTIYRWLKDFAETQNELVKTPEVRMILKEIILLAQEAIGKMDQYAILFPNIQESFAELPEYHQLIKFYTHRIERGRQQKVEKEEEEIHSLQIYLFPDLESLRKDLHYEQLFLKSNQPQYKKKLLKHLQIIVNFNELFLSQEEQHPFLGIREALEHYACEGAKSIIDLCMPHIDDFYKEAMHHKNLPFVATLNKALMAIRMAANPKQQGAEKTCLEYYHDFHFFLRLSMQVPGYREKLLLEEVDVFSHTLLMLTHMLCAQVLLRKESFKDAVDLMSYFIERGKVLGKLPKFQDASSKELIIWKELIYADRAIREFLKFFPNGPLMKAFTFFQEHVTTFNPLLYYLPCQVFSFLRKSQHVTVLRLSSPTIQGDLERADLAEEFQGFLRYYKRDLKEKKHLLFYLQDRKQKEEVSRFEILEKTAGTKEFFDIFYLVNLPKTGDFYTQDGQFEQISGSPIFFETCLEQIFGGNKKGFIFPSLIDIEEYKHFSLQAFTCIHREFFEQKTNLSQRERRDFIEVFYQLLILKCIQVLSPDSISFTCKDGVDLGSAQTAFFYAILMLFSERMPDYDVLLWLFFWPALSIRNRNLKPSCLHRSIQCLYFLHTKLLKNPKIIDSIKKLYHQEMLPVEINLNLNLRE